MDIGQLLSQLFDLFSHFNQLPLTGKMAGIILLLLSLWKSSLLRPYWDKFGPAKVFVAPGLGVVLAIVSIQPLTWATVWQSLLGGALAVALHEFLNVLKVTPGLGSGYVKVINVVETILQSPKAQARRKLAQAAQAKPQVSDF